MKSPQLIQVHMKRYSILANVFLLRNKRFHKIKLQLYIRTQILRARQSYKKPPFVWIATFSCLILANLERPVADKITFEPTSHFLPLKNDNHTRLWNLLGPAGPVTIVKLFPFVKLLRCISFLRQNLSQGIVDLLPFLIVYL